MFQPVETSGGAVNTSNSESGDLSGVQALPITLFPWTRNFTPLCLSSPACINGYGRHTAGGNHVMDKHLVQG